jgi:peroxiredoxin
MAKKKPLEETLAAIRASAPPWFDKEMNRLVDGLADAAVADKALKVGDRVPQFMLPNAEGKLKRSTDLIGDKPVVLNFYRGMWCPYCLEELKALAEVSPRLCKMGATVVAVTPEIGGAALKTKKGNELDFELLCDVDNGLAMEFGLMYRIPADIQRRYLKFNVRIPLYYGNDSWMLPIPATYIVNAEGVIAYSYVNPDFRERLDPKLLPDILASLK